MFLKNKHKNFLNNEDTNSINWQVYKILDFLGVIVVLDGSHFVIQSPETEIGKTFLNRKGIFFIKSLAIYDVNVLKRNIVVLTKCH